MRKYFLGIITGLSICGIVGVAAASYLYHADEVSFTSKNKEWQVDNVEDAISDLYDKADISKKVSELESQLSRIDINKMTIESIYNSTVSINHEQVKTLTTIDLSKYKYLYVVGYGLIPISVLKMSDVPWDYMFLYYKNSNWCTERRSIVFKTNGSVTCYMINSQYISSSFNLKIYGLK